MPQPTPQMGGMPQQPGGPGAGGMDPRIMQIMQQLKQKQQLSQLMQGGAQAGPPQAGPQAGPSAPVAPPAPPAPPKPDPLQQVLDFLGPLLGSNLLGSRLEGPSSLEGPSLGKPIKGYALGGVTGPNEELALVGEGGTRMNPAPEMITPLNQGVPGGPNSMLPAILASMRPGQQQLQQNRPMPMQQPMPQMPGTAGVVDDMINYFRNKSTQGGRGGLPPNRPMGGNIPFPLGGMPQQPQPPGLNQLLAMQQRPRPVMTGPGGTPRSFAQGGIAGQYGPEIIKVDPREAITPLPGGKPPMIRPMQRGQQRVLPLAQPDYSGTALGRNPFELFHNKVAPFQPTSQAPPPGGSLVELQNRRASPADIKRQQELLKTPPPSVPSPSQEVIEKYKADMEAYRQMIADQTSDPVTGIPKIYGEPPKQPIAPLPGGGPPSASQKNPALLSKLLGGLTSNNVTPPFTAPASYLGPNLGMTDEQIQELLKMITGW